MQRTLGDYLMIILSGIGSMVSIIAFGLLFKDNLNDQGWVGVAFLGCLTLFFLGYCIYLISKYRTRIRYAEAFEEINIGFAELHKTTRNNITDLGVIAEKIFSLTNSISNVFTKIYGHQISVCIKLIVFKNKRASAQTLSRDKKSLTKDRKTGTNDKGDHWLDLNSDFNFIYTNYDDEFNDTSFYYQTKLPIRKDYKNTRLTKWPPKEIFWGIDNIVRRKSWPLKYRSTLVVPIVPLLADEQNQKAIRGFICLDSPNESCFNTQFDVDILKGISDGLYNTIDKLQKQSGQ